MAKHKIPKNRSIEDMFQGVEEESTFETTGWEDDEVSVRRPQAKKTAKKQTASDFRRQFFTDDLQEKVGSILLDIKMAYFKDGVGDISLEVVKDDPKFDKMLAYGVDGTAEAMLLIQSGRMTSTALQNAYDLAAKNISVAHDLVTGKITQIDTDIDCPLVTKDNAKDFYFPDSPF